MIGVEKNREQESVSNFSSRVKIQKEVRTNASVSYKSILRARRLYSQLNRRHHIRCEGQIEEELEIH